jgi:hypothetical protein
MSEYEQARTVYCLAYKEFTTDPNGGLLIPMFEELNNEIQPTDRATFVNNGLIHVTKGYHNIFGLERAGTIFKVKATVDRKWDPETSVENLSKYVTYDKESEIAKYLTVSQIVDGDFPDLNKSSSLQSHGEYVPTDGFFISCTNPDNGNDVLVGPLDVEESSVTQSDDGRYTFSYYAPTRPFGGNWSVINNAPHATLVFDQDLIPDNCIQNIEGIKYLINTEQLPFLSMTLIDLSPDDYVIKWAIKLLRQSSEASPSKIKILKDIINEIPNDVNLPDEIYEVRHKRLRNLQSKFTNVQGFNHILADYLRSDDGESAIRQYVEANRSGLVERYLDQFIEIQRAEAKQRVDEEIKETNQQLNKLKSEEDILSREVQTLRATKQGLESEDLKKQIEELRKEKGLISDVYELDAKRKFLDEEVRSLDSQKDKAESLLKDVQANIRSSQETHTRELIELKMKLEAISGNVQPEVNLKADIKELGEHQSLNMETPDETRTNIIDQLTESLQERGRIVEFDEVAVLLTSVVQNLIVTLAGTPGSGKSSTVTELASTLGLIKSNKYVRVQVQRGWTSDRDILGFYNKLSHYYDPDRYGLYKMINGLQDVGSDSSFSIALLDEANLSPIEHYWSGFMGACDDSANFSTQGVPLRLPDGLRFISTVNYDRTTEPLSPRFLDRSPVIYLESKHANYFATEESEQDDKTINNLFLYSDIDRLFGRTKEATFTTDEARIMDKVDEEHRFLTISHRKKNSIRNFTHILRHVLPQESGEMMKALDYAILLNVVPMISGQGRDYSRSLESFYNFISQQGLTHSSTRLEQILSKQQYDSFSYFS